MTLKEILDCSKRGKKQNEEVDNDNDDDGRTKPNGHQAGGKKCQLTTGEEGLSTIDEKGAVLYFCRGRVGWRVEDY